ncbi:unnamed protein product [Chrysoparadoxa australica]
MKALARLISLAAMELGLLSAFISLATQFWLRRAAVPYLVRSPHLTLMTSMASKSLIIAIIVQTMLGWEDVHVSGRVPLYVSYALTPMIMYPYLMRVVRFITITSETLRQKFSFLLSWDACWLVLLVVEVFFLAVAAVMDVANWHHCYRSADDQGTCVMWLEWQIWLVLVSTFFIPGAFLVKVLLRRKDKFYVYLELTICGVVCLSTFALYQIVNVSMVQHRLIAVPANTHYILFPALLVMAFMPLSMPRLVQWWEEHPLRGGKAEPASKDGKEWWEHRPPRRDAKVVPASQDNQIWRKTYGSTETIMGQPEIAALYAKVIERNLCWESWEFIESVISSVESPPYKSCDCKLLTCQANAYKTKVPQRTAEASHEDLARILHKFVAPGALFQINIACKMARKLLKNKDKQVFMELTTEQQGDILSAPRQEMLQLLDMNVVQQLHKHPDFVNACVKVAEEEEWRKRDEEDERMSRHLTL